MGSQYAVLQGAGTYMFQQLRGLQRGSVYEVRLRMANRPGYSDDESATSSDDEQEAINEPVLYGMPESQAQEHIYLMYRRAKRLWRRMTKRPVRRFRRTMDKFVRKYRRGPSSAPRSRRGGGGGSALSCAGTPVPTHIGRAREGQRQRASARPCVRAPDRPTCRYSARRRDQPSRSAKELAVARIASSVSMARTSSAPPRMPRVSALK